MKTPTNLKYTASHEWVLANADGTISVGITDHAQELLGDMVFVQLPQMGKSYEKGADCAVVESVKSAADVYAPVAGKVVAINDAIVGAPESINQDAYATWIWKMQPDQMSDINDLLTSADYEKLADSH